MNTFGSFARDQDHAEDLLEFRMPWWYLPLLVFGSAIFVGLVILSIYFAYSEAPQLILGAVFFLPFALIMLYYLIRYREVPVQISAEKGFRNRGHAWTSWEEIDTIAIRPLWQRVEFRDASGKARVRLEYLTRDFPYAATTAAVLCTKLAARNAADPEVLTRRPAKGFLAALFSKRPPRIAADAEAIYVGEGNTAYIYPLEHIADICLSGEADHNLQVIPKLCILMREGEEYQGYDIETGDLDLIAVLHYLRHAAGLDGEQNAHPAPGHAEHAL